MNKKTIWITGGSTGIGKALAIKFASMGWNVAISARREGLLKEISENNKNIFSYPLDVTDKSKCLEVFNEIQKKFENIEICFFSTGTWNPKKEKDIDVEQIEEVFKVNFFGTLNCIKAVEKYFKEKKGGIITIVSSIAGYRGLPNSTGYGPSKSALNMIIKNFSIEINRTNKNSIIFGLHPGTVTSKLSDPFKNKNKNYFSPETSADYLYNVIETKTKNDSGKIFDWNNQEILP